MHQTFKRFVESYKLVKEINTNEFDRKAYVNNKTNPQACRFCKKIAPDVSFETDSHLIPKLLGSRYLLSHFECDDCNAHFKEYENDLANFIGIIRSIAGISGKSKNPKHKSRDITIYQDEKNVVQFESPELVKSIENGETLITIPAVKNKFTPSKVYKALLKIGLSVLDHDDTQNFDDAFKFLLSEKEDYYKQVSGSMNIMRIFVPGPTFFDSPIIHLFKRKNNTVELPEIITIIHVKNLKYVIPLPLNKNDHHLAGKTMDVPMCPINLTPDYIEQYGNFQVESINLSGREQIAGKVDDIGLRISNIKKHSR